MKHFQIKTQKDIAIISFNMADKSGNLLNRSTLSELKTILNDIEKDDKIMGAIIKSTKSSFCLGADVNYIFQMLDKNPTPADLFKKIWPISQLFSQLAAHKPIVSIINGQCLGGGLELALATSYRIGINKSKLKLALPEVKLGIIPGLGGTQRLPRLIGLEPALNLLLKGSSVNDEEGLSLGILDELCPSESTAIAAATTWIHSGQAPRALKTIHPYHSAHMMQLSAASALSKKKAQGRYPNIEYLLQAVYEGHLTSLEYGLRTEVEYFIKTLLTPQARCMIQTLYIDRQASRHKGKTLASTSPMHHIGVIGGGFMGSAIAAHIIASGLSLTLIEQDKTSLDQARDRLEGLLMKYPPAHRKKYTLSTDLSKLSTCDLVIEAVYENLELKQDILARVELHLRPGVILASNTSTIPITDLASVLKRPVDFIGIHFFSPVARMELVEIIRSKHSRTTVCDQARGFISQMGKTAILVNDCRGFYTSSVVMSYIHEALTLLTEGANPALIENAARSLGMPTPPLALLDEIGIDIAWYIKEEAHRANQSIPKDASRLLDKMYKLKRLGRKSNKGFYEYGIDKHLCSDIYQWYPRTSFDKETVSQRLYQAQVNMAQSLHKKGIITQKDANLGAIFGLGFCPWSGGPVEG